MKRILALIATISALQALPALAITGGPWDGNNFNPTNQGTYQATMLLPNGVGLLRWTDDLSVPLFGGTYQQNQPILNQSIIYFRGAVYVGGCFGYVDHQSGRVDGITQGDTISAISPGYRGRNIDQCTTHFTAKIRSRAPVLKFSGNGTATFFGELDQVEIEESTDIIEGDTEIEIQVDRFDGMVAKFPEFGHTVGISVSGSQISIQARIFGLQN